ncbi:response regulator [Haloarcula sp. GH36]|uniref:response regulator n=1 Tax=Haloarcula montana TaxID=3111776 RepID=UPI002D79F553|nr:response regulator [Haloarcula sp. GH36]
MSDRQTTVGLSRSVLRGSSTTGDRSVPLIRTESSDSPDPTRTEVPIPLAKIDDREATRILHVDDDPQIGNLVETFLERINDDFTVVTETSVVAALNRLSDEQFDCIVSDYQMPTTDGLEFLEIVREQYPELPFILFTGKGSEEIASEAIVAGVTDYMQKELGTDQYEVLANRVENAVEQYRTEQQFWNALSWYQRLVEQELAGVCIIQNREFVYVNEKLAETFGYTQDELIGASPERLTTAEDRDRFLDAVRGSEDDDPQSFDTEFTGVREGGETVTAEVSGGSIEYDGEPAWIGVLRAVED